MSFAEEQRIFDDYVSDRGLKQSGQRGAVLRAFLKTERHLTAEQLYQIAKKRMPSLGIATVYRTLKLICESGLGREMRLEDGSVMYEHLYKHKHHDHLICVKCGRLIEVVDPEIEKLQERLARKEGFALQGHRLLLYGLCRTCKD